MDQQRQNADKVICNGCQKNNRISHSCISCGSHFCVNCLMVLFGKMDQYLCPTCPDNRNLVLFADAWKNIALKNDRIQQPVPKQKVNHQQMQNPLQLTLKKQINKIKQINPHEQKIQEIQVNLPYDKSFLFLNAPIVEIIQPFLQCQNYDCCEQNTQYTYCSIECQLTYKFLIVFELNKKNDQKTLREFCVSQLHQMGEPKIQQICDSYYSNRNLARFQMIAAQEELNKLSRYRTHISTVYFERGIHYWEFKCNGNAKIGVCGQISDVCFSDREDGWAYFTKGQLRNGSDSYGKAYGQRIKQNIAIGVLLNMNEGQLSFFIDRVYEGVAFVDERLKVGPLYAAIATQNSPFQLIIPEGIPKSVLNIIKI